MHSRKEPSSSNLQHFVNKPPFPKSWLRPWLVGSSDFLFFYPSNFLESNFYECNCISFSKYKSVALLTFSENTSVVHGSEPSLGGLPIHAVHILILASEIELAILILAFEMEMAFDCA